MSQSLAVLGLVAITPAQAVHHRTVRTHYANSSTRGVQQSRTGKSAHNAKAPAGVTTVPDSGIKLYCRPKKVPLMVRKMTQGAGTTVTVICR